MRDDKETKPLLAAATGAAPNHAIGVHRVAAALDGADKKAIPALFRSLELHFGLGPSSLAMLMVGQSLALAVAAPVWGELADSSRNRIGLLAAGIAAWGLWTALTAAASAFWMLLLLRVLTGVALASVVPISQTIVADIAPPREHGYQFGALGASDALGQAVGSCFATIVGGMTVGALAGWRFVLAVLAALSFVLAAAVPFLATDPRACGGAAAPSEPRVGGWWRSICTIAQHERPYAMVCSARCWRSAIALLSAMGRKAAVVFRLRTFQLIVAQGVFGSVAAAAHPRSPSLRCVLAAGPGRPREHLSSHGRCRGTRSPSARCGCSTSASPTRPRPPPSRAPSWASCAATCSAARSATPPRRARRTRAACAWRS